MPLPYLQESAGWLFPHRNSHPRAWPFYNSNKPRRHDYRQTSFPLFSHLTQSVLAAPPQQGQQIRRSPQVHLTYY